MRATGPTLLGDAIVFASAFLLAERTVYLARAVHHLDPVKLLLSQAAIGDRDLSRALRAAGVRAHALDAGAGRLAGLPGRSHRGVLLRDQPLRSCAAIVRAGWPCSFSSQPIFGVIAAALFTGDPLTPTLLVACLAVVAGIALTTR